MIILGFLFLALSSCPLGASSYVVSKVKIKSSLLGKDRFAHHYLHEAGDYFDDAQHARSLELIRQELIDDGYLEADVRDSLARDEQSKTITVSLHLEPGPRCKISEVALRVHGKAVDDVIKRELHAIIEPLIGSYAEQKHMNDYGKRLHTFLVRKGYVKPLIELSKKQLANAQIELTYVITVSERHEFRFVGNEFLSTADLLDDLFSLIEQGISLPPALIAQDIEDLYKRKGFAQAKVRWKEAAEQVTFFIAEGERYKIRKVLVLEEFTEGKVLSVITALELALLKLPAYDEEQVDHLLHQASLQLADLGYWYLVFDKDAIRSKTTPHIDLMISVSQAGTEGAPQRMSALGILVPGYEEVLAQGPFIEWQHLSSPRPVKPADIDMQRRWLLQTIRSKGYQSAQLTYTIDKERRLVWTVDDLVGPVRFGPVQILGLQKLKPFIVQRELCFKEGDIWDKHRIDASVQRLQSLHMFESITFHPEQPVEKTQNGTNFLERPVLIKVCEDDPYEVVTRLGLQLVSKSFTNISWTTWKLGGSFIYKNPTGYADRLILDADYTRYSLNLAAMYEFPWLGPWPIRTLAKVYSDRFDQPLVSSRHHRLYKESHDGASLTFFHQHPWWTACIRTGFELNKLSGISRELARVIQFEPRLVDQRIPYVYCEPSVTFEHFDNKADPSRGFISTFSLKAMVPPTLSEGWFVKALLEQSLFYPLYDSVIGALRWRVGHIFNAKFSTILPTERFYLGGANSLRGYETNMVPPLNDVVCDGKCLWVPVGGKSMVNINAELRFPLYKALSGVVFTDMGILTQDRFADIAANQWLGASGFGLRFASPIGPVRFDIGWKWHKRDPRDKSYAFFFTLGHAF